MKVIKPLRLSLLSRPYRWQGKNYLGISILALADMGETPRLRPEPELWQLAEEELQHSGGILDLAIPKACAEFLATGYAYTHHQQEKTACAVKICLEEKEKALLVFGDRHWVNNKPSAPIPFSEMRLDWQRAFGGEGYDANPHGIGAEPEMINGARIHRLPNIESLQERITSEQQRPEPAGFGPLDIMSPSRFSRIGKKYDEHWLQHEFPGFARDIDWRLFNCAPIGQLMENHDSLPQQSRWRIWNMHPEKPVQEGRLPPWHARCFINRVREKKEETLEEIAMRATTLWFFPHREQMILIWHGSSRINEDDAADVLHIMPALEHATSPRPYTHYRKVMQQRQDKEKGALFAFREKDLIHESAIGPWLDNTSALEESPSRAHLQTRERLLREEYRTRMAPWITDIDGRLPVPEPEPPRLEDLPDFIEQMERRAEEQREEAHARLRARGINPEAPTRAENSPRGPESMHRMLDMLSDNPHGLSDKKLAQTRLALHQMYLMSAQTQQPALRLTGDLAQIIRNRATATQARDGNFSGLDFTGADFSGMDLRGADFSGALLENADFSHCQLDDVNFNQAVLTRADLSHASLHGVQMHDTSLALAVCHHSDFSGASLKNTLLQETLLSGCCFDNANCEDLTLYKTFITDCRFHHARIENTLFIELSAPALDFSHASLTKNIFITCTLERCIFDHAVLESCAWVDSIIDHIRFQSANLLTCAFSAGTRMQNADFSYATLVQSNLRAMPLSGSSFYLARLDNSDLSEADCRSNDMRGMQACGCLFMRTDFRSAKLSNSDLSGALMQKCRFSGTDLRQANLFRTDMSQSSIDATTLLDGAYTLRTKTLPRRSQEQV